MPGARRWFQLYLMTDRGYGVELVDRARDAGYDTIILTVDTPVAGRRHRDVRKGLTIPPQLTPRTIADMAVHPRWWINLLTSEPLSFATLTSTEGTVADLIARVFDPSITVADLDWLRSVWPGRLVVKGIQTVDDAVLVAEHGADGVILSTHGHARTVTKPEDYDTHARFSPTMQTRCAGLARMGAIVFSIDMFANGEGIQLYGLAAHRDTLAITIHVWTGIRALDFLLGLDGADRQGDCRVGHEAVQCDADIDAEIDRIKKGS